MSRISLSVAVLLTSLCVGTAHAALFEDDEARRAVLEVRQRAEADRLATDAAIQRLVESQAEMLRKSGEDNTQLRRALLDLQNQIESLRSDLARFNGQGEHVGRELSEVQRELKDLAGTFEKRISLLEPAKLTVDGRELLVEPAERLAFDTALARFRAGDFVAAQSGFLGLITRFPKSGYLPSALFWLGNAQYATRDYKEAITNFRIMLSAAPDHARAAEALLSIANCQIEIKDVPGARKTLEELAKTYPQSDAALAGKERLARLR